MRFIAVSLLCLSAACGGRVDGNPGSIKADASPRVASGECTRVQGSKYSVCGTIDGQVGFENWAGVGETTGTTYAVRGGSHAR